MSEVQCDPGCLSGWTLLNESEPEIVAGYVRLIIG